MRRDMVAAIYRKELLETIRDRRTLIIMLVVPMVMYPLMALVAAQVVSYMQSKLQDRDLSIAYSIPRSELLTALEDSAAEKNFTLIQGSSPEDAHSLARSGATQGAVVVLDEHVDGSPWNVQIPIELVFDSGDYSSQEARRRLVAILDQLQERVVAERLQHFGVPVEVIAPYEIDDTDLASAADRGAFLVGGMLSFLLITMALSGAIYVSVDLTAGERERGTLETLLVAPVGREQIILGKFFTVFTVAMITSLLNIVCMGLTCSSLLQGVGEMWNIEFRLGPNMFIGLLATLIPLAALFSAVTVGTSTFARSFKEGQNYLTPLFILIMFPALLPIFPGVELTLPVASVPVAGPALLFRILIMGEATLAQVLVVFTSTLLYAGFALLWATNLFNKESVLFREDDDASPRFARPQLARETPSHTRAFGVFFVLFAIYAYLSLNMSPDAGTARMLVLPQLVFLLVPLLMAWWRRNDAERTFSFVGTHWRNWLAVPLIAAGAMVLANWVAQLTAPSLGGTEALREAIDRIIVQAGPYGTIIAVALIPAVCEEVLCRGYLLSGLRSQYRTVVAVLVSALLFGVLHVELARILPTGLLGVILAVVVVRTGSIYPAMLIHFLNNAIAITAYEGYQERYAGTFAAELVAPLAEGGALAESLSEHGWSVIAGGAFLLVCGLALIVPRRRPPIDAAPADSDPAPPASAEPVPEVTSSS